MGTDVFQHPWIGGLFADDEVADLLSPERQLQSMRRVEAAYLRALAVAGVLSASKAEAAAKVVEQAPLDRDGLRERTGNDGVPVPELVRQLRAAAAPEVVETIHTGLTSQDVIDTALVLSLRDVLALIDRRLESLSGSLTTLIESHGDGPLTGRTRMQAAVPITAGDRIATWQQPLDVHRRRVSELSPRLLRLQFGGAAGNCAAFGAAGQAIAAALAERLEIQCPDRAWHAMRDPIAELAGLLSLISGTMGKMGQDIVLMAQPGLDEIALSGGGGSSTMPHKQNPVAAETLVALARFNATLLSGMHQALVHEQERSGAAWALEWMLLPQMIMATGRGLILARDLAGQIDGIGEGARKPPGG